MYKLLISIKIEIYVQPHHDVTFLEKESFMYFSGSHWNSTIALQMEILLQTSCLCACTIRLQRNVRLLQYCAVCCSGACATAARVTAKAQGRCWIKADYWLFYWAVYLAATFVLTAAALAFLSASSAREYRNTPVVCVCECVCVCCACIQGKRERERARGRFFSHIDAHNHDIDAHNHDIDADNHDISCTHLWPNVFVRVSLYLRFSIFIYWYLRMRMYAHTNIDFRFWNSYNCVWYVCIYKFNCVRVLVCAYGKELIVSCTYSYTCSSVYAYLFTCVYVHKYIHVCTSMHIYIHTDICICTYMLQQP